MGAGIGGSSRNDISHSFELWWRPPARRAAPRAREGRRDADTHAAKRAAQGLAVVLGRCLGGGVGRRSRHADIAHHRAHERYLRIRDRVGLAPRHGFQCRVHRVEYAGDVGGEGVHGRPVQACNGPGAQRHTRIGDNEVQRQSLALFEQVLTEPTFAEDEIERRRLQMRVALEKQKESPAETAKNSFFEKLYGDHPYAHDPGGNDQSIEAMTREDIVAFFKRYYVAGKVVIALVGAIDRARAEEIAEELTRNMPAGEKAPTLPKVSLSEKGDELAVDFPSSQTHIYMGQPVMARGDDDFFPLYVGNHMLGGSGLVSMLSDEVREKRGLAYSVYSYFSQMQNKGPFVFNAQTRTDRAHETLAVIRQTLEEFMKDGPDEERLTAARKNITGSFPLQTSSNANIVEYIAMMGFYDYPLDYLDTFIDKVNAVSAEEIQDAFRRRVNPDAFLVVTVGKNGT